MSEKLTDFRWHVVNRGIGWEVHAIDEGSGSTCWCLTLDCIGDALSAGNRGTMSKEWAGELVKLLNRAPQEREPR